MPGLNEYVTIGRILKPFGVNGEVRVESLSDVPDRFENLPSVTLVTTTGQSLETTMVQTRSSGHHYLVKFSAFSSPEEAASFRGALIQVPQDSVPPSPPEQYYQFEIVGMKVQDENQRQLGKVEEILDLPQHPIFVARQHEHEYLIPATHQVIKQIDLNGQLIIVTPIEHWGLLHAV